MLGPRRYVTEVEITESVRELVENAASAGEDRFFIPYHSRSIKNKCMEAKPEKAKHCYNIAGQLTYTRPFGIIEVMHCLCQLCTGQHMVSCTPKHEAAGVQLGQPARVQVASKGIVLPLEVFMTQSKGWGVRCGVDIPSGTFICEYTGELISNQEAVSRISETGQRLFSETLP